MAKHAILAEKAIGGDQHSMKKTVKTVKNSLKFKAQPKDGILTVRVGVKKYTLPVEARILSDENYIFLSFSASTELYKVDGKTLAPMPAEADAAEAHAALTPKRHRTRRKKAAAQVPAEVVNALKKIAKGYRLGFDADGEPKLVRTRKRS